MPKPFNLTAQLNIVGPTNLRPVVNNLRKQLSGINTNVNVNISRSASRNVSVLNKSVQNLTKSLQQANSQASTLSATMAQLGATIKNIGSSTGKATSGLNNVSNSANQVGKSVQQAGSQMEEFGRISGLALRRYAGFTVATTLTFGFVRAVSDAVGEALKFERELIKVAQVTGSSIKSLKSLTSEIGKLSTSLGVSSTELLEVSRTLSQAGLSATEAKRALDALAKSALAPTFNDIRNTTEGVIAVMSQFGIGARNIEKVLGSLNAVAGKFAVEAEDLISVIRRTGGVFKAASGDIGSPIKQLNELVAVFTSVRATTRESAESIATGLRTIFTRIQRPSTLKFLKQLGVNLQDLEGKFVGPFKAMQLLNQALVSLDPRDVRYAKIVEQLGGFRQVGKLIPAIQQFAKAQEALGVAMAGQGSLAKDAQTAQQSLLVQTQKVREEFLKLFRDITGDSSFQVFAKGALQLASSLIKLADSFRPILPMLTAVATIKAGSALKQFGTGFFGGIRSAGGAKAVGSGLAGAATGAGGQAANQASQALQAITKANTSALQANTKAVAFLSGSVKNLSRIVASRGFGGGPRGPRAPRIRPRLGGQVYPRKFASGGFVPGSGNYDNVPAMLTPGEFVIKKSAAQALGPDYLNSVNRRQRGGKIQRFKNGKEVKPPEPSPTTVTVTDPDYGVAGYQLQGDVKQKAREYGKIDGVAKSAASQERLYEAVESAGGLPKDTSGKNISQSEFVKRGQKSGGLPLKVIASPYISFMNKKMDAMFTQVFEDNFDAFISGILTAGFGAGTAAIPKALNNTPTEEEIKTSLKKELQPETIGGLMFQGFTNAFTRTKPPDDTGQGRWDLAPSTSPDLFGNLFDSRFAELTDADNKNTINSNMIASVVDKAIGGGKELVAAGPGLQIATTTPGGEMDAGREESFKSASVRYKEGKKKASGGSIAGSDTVPALLTPGEFVINKQSASRIGLGNLNRMNRGQVKGYDRGGLVMGAMMGAPMVGGLIGGPKGDAVSSGAMGGVLAMSMLSDKANMASKSFVFIAGAAYAAADSYIKATNELEKMQAQEKMDKAGESIATILEKFGSTISQHTDELEANFRRMNEAVASMNEVQQGSQGVFQALREALGSSNAQAIRQENEVGLSNILFAQLSDFFTGGNEEEKLRIRGEEMATRREAETGAPAKAQAEDVLRARFREQALQQIAQGQDPMKQTTADVDFARANTEQLKAIAAGDAAIIEERKNMIAAGTYSQEQINARIDQMIENRVKKLEEETDRLVIAENAAGVFNDTIDLMGKRFAGIAGVAKRVGQEMQALSRTMNLQVAAAQGQAGVDLSGNAFSSVLGNMQGFTQAEIQSTIGSVGTTMGMGPGSPTAFSELANVVSTTSSLQAALPQLIQDALVVSGGALGDDFTNTLEDSILTTTGADPNDPFIKEMLASITSQLTVGADQQGQVGQAAINTLVNSALENLSQRAEAAGKAMEEIGKVIDEQMKAFGEAINQQTGLIMAANAAQERVNQILFRQQQQMAELTGQPLNLEQMFAPFESQLQSLTGGLTDVNEITNQRAILKAQSESLQQDLSTPGKTPEELARLGATAAQVNAQLNETHAALELLASDTTRQAAIVQKLNKLNEARSGAKNILEAIMTGDPQELMKFTRGMNMVGAQQSGMLDTSMLSGEDRGLMLQIVRSLQPLAGADAGFGIPENAFSDANLLGAMAGDFGLGGGPLANAFLNLATSNQGDSANEVVLLGLLRDINAEQRDAAVALAEEAKKIQEDHGEYLKQMPTEMAKALATQIERIVNEINIQHASQTAGVTAIGGMGAPGVDPNLPTMVGGQLQYPQMAGGFGPQQDPFAPRPAGYTSPQRPGHTGEYAWVEQDGSINPLDMQKDGTGTRTKPIYLAIPRDANNLGTNEYGITQDGNIYIGLNKGGVGEKEKAGFLEKMLLKKKGSSQEILEKLAGKSVPGVGDTDKVAALLTPEEYVVNKRASLNNREILEQINAMGASRKFRLVAARQGGAIGLNQGGSWGSQGGSGINYMTAEQEEERREIMHRRQHPELYEDGYTDAEIIGGIAGVAGAIGAYKVGPRLIGAGVRKLRNKPPLKVENLIGSLNDGRFAELTKQGRFGGFKVSDKTFQQLMNNQDWMGNLDNKGVSELDRVLQKRPRIRQGAFKFTDAGAQMPAGSSTAPATGPGSTKPPTGPPPKPTGKPLPLQGKPLPLQGGAGSTAPPAKPAPPVKPATPVRPAAGPGSTAPPAKPAPKVTPKPAPQPAARPTAKPTSAPRPTVAPMTSSGAASSLDDTLAAMKGMNRNQILGINGNSTPQQIKAAYRRMSVKFHPDKFGASDEAAKTAAKIQQLINNAKATVDARGPISVAAEAEAAAAAAAPKPSAAPRPTPGTPKPGAPKPGAPKPGATKPGAPKPGAAPKPVPTPKPVPGLPAPKVGLGSKILARAGATLRFVGKAGPIISSIFAGWQAWDAYNEHRTAIDKVAADADAKKLEGHFGFIPEIHEASIPGDTTTPQGGQHPMNPYNDASFRHYIEQALIPYKAGTVIKGLRAVGSFGTMGITDGMDFLYGLMPGEDLRENIPGAKTAVQITSAKQWKEVYGTEPDAKQLESIKAGKEFYDQQMKAQFFEQAAQGIGEAASLAIDNAARSTDMEVIAGGIGEWGTATFPSRWKAGVFNKNFEDLSIADIHSQYSKPKNPAFDSTLSNFGLKDGKWEGWQPPQWVAEKQYAEQSDELKTLMGYAEGAAEAMRYQARYLMKSKDGGKSGRGMGLDSKRLDYEKITQKQAGLIEFFEGLKRDKAAAIEERLTTEKAKAVAEFPDYPLAEPSWVYKASQSQAMYDYISRGERSGKPERSDGQQMSNIPSWFVGDNPADTAGIIEHPKTGNKIYPSDTFSYGGQFPWNFSKQHFGGSSEEKLLSKENRDVVAPTGGHAYVDQGQLMLKGVPQKGGTVKTGDQAQLYVDGSAAEYGAMELMKKLSPHLKSVGVLGEIEKRQGERAARASLMLPHSGKAPRDDSNLELRIQMAKWLIAQHFAGESSPSEEQLLPYSEKGLRELEKDLRRIDDSGSTRNGAVNKSEAWQAWIQRQARAPVYKKGGILGGQKHSAGGTIIEAERGEFVVNANATSKNRGLLEALNNGGVALPKMENGGVVNPFGSPEIELGHADVQADMQAHYKRLNEEAKARAQKENEAHDIQLGIEAERRKAEEKRMKRLKERAAIEKAKAAKLLRFKQVRAGYAQGSEEDKQAFIQGGPGAPVLGPEGGLQRHGQVIAQPGSPRTQPDPKFRLPSGEEVPFSQLPKPAQESIRRGSSQLQQVQAPAGGGGAGGGAAAPTQGPLRSELLPPRQTATTPGEAASFYANQLTGGMGGFNNIEGDLSLRDKPKRPGGGVPPAEGGFGRGGAGAGGAGGTGADFAAFAQTMEASAVTLSTMFEQFNGNMTTITEAANIFDAAATKIHEAAQSLASLPEKFTHEHDVSVSVSNDQGFAQVLGKTIKDEVAKEVFDRIKGLIPETDAFGENTGVGNA